MASPLRFLFVTADRFPPFRPDVETLFGKEFVNRGHRIDWVMQAGEGSDSGLVSWRGCRVWVARTDSGTNRAGRLRKHLRSVWNEVRSASRIRKHSYDFVQVKDRFVSAVFLLFVARLRGVPFFYWLSFPYPEASLLEAKAPTARYPLFYRFRGLFFKFALYRIICRFADHVFVQSDHMKRAMAGSGVPEDLMTPVPMGVDLAAFPSESAGPGHSTSPTVVYLGSLGRARRLDVLIDAFAIVRKQLPASRLLLIGEGDEPEDRPALAARAEQAGLADNVVFTGFVPRERAMELLESAWVGVSPIPPSPMYDVSSPTKILEYMAARIPVVANDQPDQRLVLEQSGAGICTPFEPAAIAEGMLVLLRDRRRSREMGISGREYVSAFRSYSALADLVENRYRELLSESQAARSAEASG